jgi:hypothetical protein
MARVDHRSYRAQGIEREPVPMMPQKVYYAERSSGAAHPLGEDIPARHRERSEARLAGRGAARTSPSSTPRCLSMESVSKAHLVQALAHAHSFVVRTLYG